MSKHHDLKCLPQYFEQVVVGKKTFEVRINDRDYQQGDTIKLHEYDAETKKYSGFSSMTYRIGYVLDLRKYLALDDTFVVLSLVIEPDLNQHS